jgi:hypothetical protein
MIIGKIRNDFFLSLKKTAIIKRIKIVNPGKNLLIG